MEHGAHLLEHVHFVLDDGAFVGGSVRPLGHNGRGRRREPRWLLDVGEVPQVGGVRRVHAAEVQLAPGSAHAYHRVVEAGLAALRKKRSPIDRLYRRRYSSLRPLRRISQCILPLLRY